MICLVWSIVMVKELGNSSAKFRRGLHEQHRVALTILVHYYRKKKINMILVNDVSFLGRTGSTKNCHSTFTRNYLISKCSVKIFLTVFRLNSTLSPSFGSSRRPPLNFLCHSNTSDFSIVTSPY